MHPLLHRNQSQNLSFQRKIQTSLKMSHSEYSTRVRVSPFIERYLKQRAGMMGQSINEVIKFAIISLMERDRFDTAPVPPTVTNQTMTLMPVTAEVVKSDTAHGDKSGTPSRAPSSSDLYTIKKDIVIINNHKLQEAWDEFAQHRKEIKKAIRPTQLKRMWADFDKIIEKHGEDGLISCLNKSVTCGWQGVFDTHLNDEHEQAKSSSGVFTMEDI